MEELLKQIEDLKNSNTRKIIDARVKEFQEVGKEKQDRIFSELCFCLMTAGFQAEKCIRIQKQVGRGFNFLPEEQLAAALKEAGHRFWPQRAERIVAARSCSRELHDKIFKQDGKEMRIWLVDTVKGIGMKEASHFLRNIGYTDVAIIDFHILDLLEKHHMVEKPKAITPKTYEEIENILENLAKKANLNLSELDLYLWYIETGKILK
jgi:N-glycosylase/DNA lyase